MSHVLLIGAGFSNNWGGYLAQEVEGALFGRLAEAPELRDLLQRAGSYEEALGQVQAEYRLQDSAANRRRLDLLQSAILAVFAAMNDSYVARGGIEFSQDRDFSILRFLSNFDAIFSLNQDLLFELYYDIGLQGGPRHTHSFPCMQSPPNWQGRTLPDRMDEFWLPVEARDFRIDNNTQPIFKLHGSVNWRDRDGGALIVMGVNKPASINQRAILNWYSEQFVAHLSRPNTRLMVVGYGFFDQHINEVIIQASHQHGLAIFLVHPRGRQAWNRHPEGSIRPIYPLDDVPIVGESTRPFSSTFRNDVLAHRQIMAFFPRR